MSTSFVIRRVVPVLMLGSIAASVAAQSEMKPTNLKVLPQDMPREKVVEIMGGFTRALGVRCVYCHVGEEGKPLNPADFAKDDKPAKEKARVMLRMVQDINDKYLTQLETRATPAVGVQCVTCHRGTTQPRMLQDVLKIAYDQGGLDSTEARYRALRDRYYGRSTYDFGEVPLADVARGLRMSGHGADAVKLHALNIEMNPNSVFAKRQGATSAILVAYTTQGADSGATAYHAYQALYGPKVVGEEMLNQVGYDLLGADKKDVALAAFRLNVAENPASANAYDSLGEFYAETGDTKQALASYQKSLELDPTNDNAKHEIEQLKAKPKEK